MDFSIDISNINMNMYIKPIQPSNLPIKDISEFPSEQAEAIQNKLKELDEQGKLKEEFLKKYGNNLGKPNSLANYILEDFENRKHLFIEWTGIETFSDKHTIAAIGIKLNEVTKGSGRYFLWKCSTCQYGWVTMTDTRTGKNSGCPACAGNIIVLGQNDLLTWCNTQGGYGQQLKEEFTGKLEDGTPIKIEEISRGSNIKIWWKCSKCGYKWASSPNDRTCKKRYGCQECGKKKSAEASRLKGESLDHWCDTQEKYGIKIRKEFMGKTKSGEIIKIQDISKASNINIKWKCSKCGYEWYSKPVARTGRHKSGCPHCAANTWTSFPEQFIYNSLKQLFPNTKNRQKDIIKHYEYDIVIPELNICIEYSSYKWH